jgi:hypothetical protein
VHQRLSTLCASACRHPSHVHVGPHWQASPHWHDEAGGAAEVWQPQAHWIPTQVPHSQVFD